MGTMPRSYRDMQDLEKMHDILVKGRLANTSAYYVTPGDLSWWLFYSTPENDLWPYIYLWEDPAGDVMGWTLLTPREGGIDVFVRPDLHGSDLQADLYAWSIEKAAMLAPSFGIEKIFRMWVSENDAITCKLLEDRGFLPVSASTCLEYSLVGELPQLVLPDGFQARSVAGESELEKRAQAQYSAFESEMEFKIYCQRYLRFMRSPAYSFNRDVVISAPDGRIAAFCIIWEDQVNRVGLFEPVGTHPDFQRRGLGKAVMLEGLRRLQAAGMRKAIVSTSETHTPAVSLYETSGFRQAYRLLIFEKSL